MPKARTPDSTQSTPNDTRTATTAGPAQPAENESANAPAPPKEDKTVTLPNGATWTVAKDWQVDHPNGAIACPTLEAVHLFAQAMAQSALDSVNALKSGHLSESNEERNQERYGKAAYVAGCDYILPDAPIELISQIPDQQDGLKTLDIVHYETSDGRIVGAFLPAIIEADDSEKQQ